MRHKQTVSTEERQMDYLVAIGLVDDEHHEQQLKTFLMEN